MSSSAPANGLINPCFCCSLQTGTRVIGIVEIISSVIVNAVIIWEYVTVEEHGDFGGQDNEDYILILGKGRTWFTVSFVILLLCYVFSFIMGIILILGANQKNMKLCKIWFYFFIILIVLTVIQIICYLILNQYFHWGTLIEVLLDIYFLWVVYSFIEELKMG